MPHAPVETVITLACGGAEHAASPAAAVVKTAIPATSQAQGLAVARRLFPGCHPITKAIH